MAIDAMSDSCLFQLEKYFDSHPSRGYIINRPYATLSVHSHRLYKPSSRVFQQFMNSQKNPLIIDRIAYKLRIKSDLNVDTQREFLSPHEHYHTNSPVNEPVTVPTRAATTTKTHLRQSTAVTRTTQSMRTVPPDGFRGIEGNAVRVGTLDDLIKHFHREEIRLDNLSNYTNHRLIRDGKTPAFLSERVIKRPQTLTEYRFKTPSPSSHTPHPNLSRLTAQYSLKQSSTGKQPARPRAKTSLHTAKRVSQLTIANPFDSESRLPSTRYLFPPVRPFGYFTRKSLDDTPYRTSAPLKKRPPSETKRSPQSPVNSVEEISTDADQTPPSPRTVHRLNTNLTDDFDNPPNSTINLNIKP